MKQKRRQETFASSLGFAVVLFLITVDMAVPEFEANETLSCNVYDNKSIAVQR